MTHRAVVRARDVAYFAHLRRREQFPVCREVGAAGAACESAEGMYTVCEDSSGQSDQSNDGGREHLVLWVLGW